MELCREKERDRTLDGDCDCHSLQGCGSTPQRRAGTRENGEGDRSLARHAGGEEMALNPKI